jgi:hypothetical protein
MYSQMSLDKNGLFRFIYAYSSGLIRGIVLVTIFVSFFHIEFFLGPILCRGKLFIPVQIPIATGSCTWQDVNNLDEPQPPQQRRELRFDRCCPSIVN